MRRRIDRLHLRAQLNQELENTSTNVRLALPQLKKEDIENSWGMGVTDLKVAPKSLAHPWLWALVGIVVTFMPPISAFFYLNHICSTDTHEQSWDPNRTPDHQRNETGSHAPKSQRDPPTAVFEIDAPKDKKITGRYYAAKEEAEHREWGREFVCDVKAGEFSIATFTWLLFLATGLLAFSTYKLWESTGQLAHAAVQQGTDMQRSLAIGQQQAGAAITGANAAKYAARTARDVELPMIFVTEIKLVPSSQWTGDVHVHLPTVGCRVEVTYENFGRTAAVIMFSNLEFRMQLALPEKPDYGDVRNADIGTIVKPGDTGAIDTENNVLEFTQEEIFNQKNNLTNLWVYGLIVYHDFLGVPHQTRFCSRWVNGDSTTRRPHHFIEDGPDNYRGRT